MGRGFHEEIVGAGSGKGPAGGPERSSHRFGDVVVDLAAQTVERAGQAQPLEPKAFAVLAALLRRPGEVLTHEQLLDQVWGHRHVTVGVLTRAVAQIRAALGDDRRRPRYLETRHAVGYRFIGNLQAEPADAGAPEAEPADRPGTPRPAARRRSPRPLPVLAALLVVLAVVMVWPGWLRPPAPAPPTVPVTVPSIAVLPFTNLSDDRSDDHFAEGLAVELHDTLARVQGLKVAARLPRAIAARPEEDIQALGRRLGVAVVLDASVRREGPVLRINARLSDCASGFTIWSRQFEGEADALLATQSNIARQVVQSLLGALPQGDAGLSTRPASTRSGSAYQAYLQGLGRWQQDDGGERSVALALERFEQALGHDPGFARAQAMICRLQVHRYASEQRPDAYAQARDACARAAAADADDADVLLANADLHRIRGEAEPAQTLYLRVQADPVRAPDALVGLAKLALQGGDLALAQDRFRQALALRPGDPHILAALGYAQFQVGALAEAIASYRLVVELLPDNAEHWSVYGSLLATADDHVGAIAAFERSLAIKPVAEVFSNLAAFRYLDGDFDAAERQIRQAIGLSPGYHKYWGYLGDVLLAREATRAQAADAYRQAARLVEAYLQQAPDDGFANAALAWYQVNLGDPAQARRLLVRAEAAPAPTPAQRGRIAVLNAQTLAALGDVEAARERVAAARQSGVSEYRIAGNFNLRRIETPDARSEPARAAPTQR